MIPGPETISSAQKPSREEVAAQVAAIMGSACLQNSEASRRLLAFLAEWNQRHPGEHIKESEIAFAVFQRRPGDFDPQTDSVVRVQMARLRKKIREYYLEQGEANEIFIDIPKGSYSIVASHRSPAAVSLSEESEPARPSYSSKLRRRYWPAVAWLLSGIAAGAGAMLLIPRPDANSPTPLVRQFWSQVIQKNAQSVMVFPNPRLAGTLAIDGLRYFREGVDSQDPTSENYSYTGAGDVQSAAQLTRVFDSLHLDLKVRSGALLSWGQARESNLIFVGRPEQNPALQQLPRLPEFYFKFSTGIVNAHPKQGERAIYDCSKRPYTYDYAVIALIPGLNRNLNTLVLAGNTTYGSLSATEFVSDERSMASLFHELALESGRKIPYFEAVIEVRINQGTPIWSKVVATRLISADDSSWTAALPDEK